jgi:hypothetical protein
LTSPERSVSLIDRGFRRGEGQCAAFIEGSDDRRDRDLISDQPGLQIREPALRRATSTFSASVSASWGPSTNTHSMLTILATRHICLKCSICCGRRNRTFCSGWKEYLDRPQRSLLDVLAEQQAKLRKLPLNHPDRDKIALRIINLDGEMERRPESRRACPPT